MKKLILVSFLYLITMNVSVAQANDQHKIDPSSKPQIANFNTLQAQVSVQPASESAYFGYDHEIEAFLISNVIPASFPTKIGFANKTLYKEAMNDWFSKNQASVKAEYKNKTITE